MLFNFKLVPLEKIEPWGDPGNQRLHWFGLTDGEYWIQAGDNALLEYSAYVQNKSWATRYCDYQVVRLYEDLMEMVPYVLEPVPDSLVPYLSGESGKLWEDTFRTWCANVVDSSDNDRYWEISDVCVTWIGNRILDTGYLSPSANIRMWSDTSMVHIEWDNAEKLFEGLSAWSAVRGSYQMPREVFKEEVRSFHARLMEQMSERVQKVLAGALPPEVQVDLPGLEREHLQRRHTIETALAEPAIATDWQLIREGIAEVERGSNGRQV